MNLILITNNCLHAAVAQEAGVDYIMVDLEILGKEARQGHLNTVISRHTIEDVRLVRSVIDRSRLMVRINPIFDGSQEEIDQCIEANVDVIMLPMFTKVAEVDKFIDLVAGRARTCLLLETPQAFVRVDQIMRCSGVDSFHVGLNDLHLGMGLDFMFELLAYGQVEWLANQFIDHGIEFGFGGVARLNTGMLSSRLILSEHVRLGSNQVILSRDFHRIFDEPFEAARRHFCAEIASLRNELHRLRQCSAKELEGNSVDLKHVVSDLIARKCG